MSNRRNFMGLAVSAALGALSVMGAGSAMAQDVTLRLHQFLPPQANVPRLVLDVWADQIEAESNGRIVIERYPAMALGGTPPELMDQVIDGIAEYLVAHNCQLWDHHFFEGLSLGTDGDPPRYNVYFGS